jgi:hypothetical protein
MFYSVISIKIKPMRAWAYWVHDNLMLIIFFVLIALILLAWLVLEAVRSHRSRDEILRLRRRLYELERHSDTQLRTGPSVLPSRWVRVGSAVTTVDGGCLVLVNSVSPVQRKAVITIRVDGYAARQNEPMFVGSRAELIGKSGIYVVELHATEPRQARLEILLRSPYVEYADEREPA